MDCPDGLHLVPRVNGSTWMASKGIWTLISCPPGYSLTAGQCELCPAACYCTGGSIPPTPCGLGLFSLPGAKSVVWCYPVVFVVVVLELPIFRQGFTAQAELTFQQALATKVGVEYDLVLVVGIMGDIETAITTNIATPDARAAAVLYRNLRSYSAENWTKLDHYVGSNLISIQVSGCVPGYTLDSSQICQLCPSNFYCNGGSEAALPCPIRSFSMPGANSSVMCIPAVFVVVTLSFSLASSNFSGAAEYKLQSAVALTADISVGRIVIVSLKTSRRSLNPSLDITLDIAADNVDVATSIVKKLDTAALNVNLQSQGLPSAILKSVIVTATQDAQSGNSMLEVVIGSLVGVSILLFMSGLVLYYRNAEPEDEKQLHQASRRLRARLGIRMRDGYLLDTETAFGVQPLLWRLYQISFKFSYPADGPRILQRSYLEAASRLSMLQVLKLLSLCLTLVTIDLRNIIYFPGI